MSARANRNRSPRGKRTSTPPRGSRPSTRGNRASTSPRTYQDADQTSAKPQDDHDSTGTPDNENKSQKWPQYMAATSASMGAVAAGMVMGWTSPANPKKISEEYGFDLSSEEFSLVSSLAIGGFAISCFLIGVLIEAIGRKNGMLVLVIPFTIGWLIIIFSVNVAMLIVGRFVTGLSGGAFCTSFPIYTGEICEKEVRGKLGCFFSLMLSAGILLAYVFGSYIGTLFWFNIACLIMPLIFGGTFIFMPESPLYLLYKGKDEKAEKALQRLRGANYDITSEMNDMKTSNEARKANKLPLRKAFVTKAARKGFTISMFLMLFMQISGMISVVSHSAKMFHVDGVSSENASIIVGIVKVVTVLLSIAVIDKLGRRILLIASAAIMSISLLGLGTYTIFDRNEAYIEKINSITWIPLLALCLYMFAFSLGFGPVPWMMVGELFPPNIKGIAGSISTSFNWTTGFLVSQSFLPISEYIGEEWPFFIYGLACAISVIFVYVYVPETKAKTLDEIQAMLGGETNSEEN